MLFRRRPGSPGSVARPGWPSLCAVCHDWGDGRVCAACIERFARPRPRCLRCAVVVPEGTAECGACLAAPPPFDATLASVDYDFPWDRLITMFKFHAATDLAPTLAGLLADAPGHADRVPVDLVLPVPLAASRLRERGFNQAWELARRAARRLNLAAEPRLLLRLRDTPHQIALPPAERAGNVRGAFAIEPPRRSEVHGRAVAVVDDVMTTGDTLAEIARVLKQAGATHVAAWVVARTPPPGA